MRVPTLERYSKHSCVHMSINYGQTQGDSQKQLPLNALLTDLQSTQWAGNRQAKTGQSADRLYATPGKGNPLYIRICSKLEAGSSGPVKTVVWSSCSRNVLIVANATRLAA